MPRRDQNPPYEILRHNGAGSESPWASRKPASSGSHSGTQWRLTGTWLPQWLRGGPEMEIRLPRTLALTLGGGMLGLVLLAFILGYTQGQTGAQPRPGDGSAGVGASMINPAYSAPPPRGEHGQGAAATTGDSLAGDNSANDDPRQAGLNYMVLAEPKREDAPPLVDFLNRHGVDTILVPVHGDSVKIVAVNEGFAAQELDSDHREEYEKWLRRVCRLWKYDLSSMYLARYDGSS